MVPELRMRALSMEVTCLDVVWRDLRETVSVRFSAQEDAFVVITLNGGVDVRGAGSDLFEALKEVCLRLEEMGALLLCNGARIDVYPSQMQRQATRGRRAYVMTLPRGPARPESVDIFAPARLDLVGSVAEQREFFERWLLS
ncbi:hypothetical protein [Streptosporangium sp. NBC_01469]|uniref:hypothetical protein n=1 Tax=Streptosporangium sp. NBC_01469 TaxID=2903898 RepID=UPI002E2C6566|nr:hypothetical protein [Streptosporangium sp. NBC_01469]